MNEELNAVTAWEQAVEAMYLAVPTSARGAMAVIGIIGIIMVVRWGRSSVATNAIGLGVIGVIGLTSPTIWGWMAVASGKIISWGAYGLYGFLIVGLGALALRPKPNKAEQARKALDNLVRLQKEMQR